MVLSLAIPMWNFTHQVLALESEIGTMIAVAGILVVDVFIAIVPLFYFALYRNAGDLHISGKMRWIAATAATVIGILTLSGIPGWFGSLRGDSVLDTTARQWTVNDTAAALSLIAELAGILLLVALCRLAGDTSSETGVAVSTLLRSLSKVAVIAGGIVAFGCVIGLVATPWVYFYIRDRSLEMGFSNERWTFSRLAMDRLRTALTIILVYVAPFVVWQGTRNRLTNTLNNPG
jgi:hypothetical protein